MNSTETTAEQISANITLAVNKMNEETIAEYRRLSKFILETAERIKKSSDLAVAEIDAHIAWLQSKDKSLSDQLTNHVAFVNDALHGNSIVSETFKNMQARYQEPSK